MREIKFRYWDNDTKEMIYFDLQWIFDCGDKWRDEGGNGKFDVNEIMQCTGIKDREENEIYEGDIMQASVGHDEFISAKYVVTWWPGYACFFPFSNMELSSIKIIGNIYENPELAAELRERKDRDV